MTKWSCYCVVIALIALGICGCSRESDESDVDTHVAILRDAYSTGDEGEWDRAVKVITRHEVQDAVPQLLRIARTSPDFLERYCAVAAIAAFEDRAISAQATLLELYAVESSDQVRLVILRGVTAINSSSTKWAHDHLDLLINALRSDYPLLRDEAAWLIGTLGTDAAQAIPNLIDVLLDPNANLNARRLAAASLANIGPRHEDVHRALLLASEDEYIAGAAADALRKIRSSEE